MVAYIKHNWFWPLSALLFGVAWLISSTQPQKLPKDWELALIFDALVTLPAMFFVCYRGKLSKKVMILRIVALQCLGIWLVTKLAPTNDQEVLQQLILLRYAGIGVLVLIELRLIIAMFRIIFRQNITQRNLEDIGMPPLLAKWALLEARFWRWVFSFFKR